MLAATALVGALTGSGAAAASKKSPIVIGFVTSDTGLAASSYTHSEYGAIARIKAQNAAGGVNGHPLQLEVQDDGSSFANNLTVSQDLVQNKSAFAVVEDTSFTAGSYKWLNQQGVPVIGAAIDGNEWNTPPNSNMFSVNGVIGPFGDTHYANDDMGKFFKDAGVTKLAGLAFNIPSAVSAIKAAELGAQRFGIQTCLTNTTVSFGQVDFGAIVLQMKNAGCDGVYCACLLSSDIALAKQLKQAGLTNVKPLWPVAYDQTLLDQKSGLQAMDGNYTGVTLDTTLNPNPATKLMMSRLKKYAGFKGSIPSLNMVFGYLSADLAITGLQRAGKTPTRKSFIKGLRNYDKWTGGGIWSTPIIFSHFGTPAMVPKTGCMSVLAITSTGYQKYKDGKPFCGVRFSF